MKIYTIDGKEFDSLESFYDIFSQKLIPGYPWGRNLDAFNDILRGGFGTPEEGFILQWKNSNVSRKALGYAETLRWLENGLSKIHPSNIPIWEKRINQAKQEKGLTLFDELVDIIKNHKNIELRLE